MSWRTYTDLLKRHPAALRLADRLGRGRGRHRWLDRLGQSPPPAPRRPEMSKWEELELAAVCLGHATVLLRIEGQTILTDPVFSHRVGLGMGLATVGPRRLVAPALRIGELPPVDVILISHAHFDHLDRPSLDKLPKTARVVTARGTSDLISDMGFGEVSELDWNQSLTIGSITFKAQEVRHWGARVFFDKHRGYNGYFISGPRRRVLYAGDTAGCDCFREGGRVDLGIFSISAYNPYIQAHATPEQVWEMAGQLPADVVLPMHYGTFRLSHEPMDEPMQRLIAAAGSQAVRIVGREIGEMWSV
jgi:L-ascorbate metabolism protein UlaG (beta-lactamase superfamily)